MGEGFKFLGGVGVHRLAPTQAGDDATTYYDDAGDDGDDVAARAELGEFDVFCAPGAHRSVPAQATTYYGDDSTYAGDDGDDYGDDVASCAEMGEF